MSVSADLPNMQNLQEIALTSNDFTHGAVANDALNRLKTVQKDAHISQHAVRVTLPLSSAITAGEVTDLINKISAKDKTVTCLYIDVTDVKNQLSSQFANRIKEAAGRFFISSEIPLDRKRKRESDEDERTTKKQKVTEKSLEQPSQLSSEQGRGTDVLPSTAMGIIGSFLDEDERKEYLTKLIDDNPEKLTASVEEANKPKKMNDMIRNDLFKKDASTEISTELSAYCQTVEQLDLSEIPLTKQHIERLVKLCPKIQSLNLSSTGIKPEHIDILTKLPCLTSLELRHNQFKDADVKVIAAMLPHSTITSLDLSHNTIGIKYDARVGYGPSDGVKALAAALPHSKITHLDLSDNDILSDGIHAIATALKNSQLTYLDLRGNEHYTLATFVLATALKDSQLTYLGLEGTFNHPLDGLYALIAMLPYSKLTSLNFNGFNLGRTGFIECLALVLKESQLTNLTLARCNIESDNMQTLADVLLHSNLTSLSLKDNQYIYSPQALVAALPDSKLRYLNLTGSGIQDYLQETITKKFPFVQFE